MEEGHHQVEQFHFLFGQVEAAGLEGVLSLLTGSAANDHQRHVAAHGGGGYLVGFQRHFRIGHGPLTPDALVRHIFGETAPGFILGSQQTIHLHLMLQQPVHQVAAVGGNHVTAAAVANGEIVHGTAAKHGHTGVGLDGQGAIFVFQQHDAVGGQGTGFRCDFGNSKLADNGSTVQFLLQAGFRLRLAMKEGAQILPWMHRGHQSFLRCIFYFVILLENAGVVNREDRKFCTPAMSTRMRMNMSTSMSMR